LYFDSSEIHLKYLLCFVYYNEYYLYFIFDSLMS